MACMKTEAILAVLGNGPSSLQSQSNICIRIDSQTENWSPNTLSLLKNLLSRRQCEMQKWSCSHRQIRGNIRTRPQKTITEVHTDGYRSGTVKPHPSCWYLASWEHSKTSSHLLVCVCVDTAINSSLMPNSLAHTASSRMTQKQVTAIVPHHRSDTKQRNVMEQFLFVPYVRGGLASFPLFLLPTNPLFTRGLFNGFPSPGGSNAFLTLVTLDFLKKSEQSWSLGEEKCSLSTRLCAG